ncbi:MAG: DNA polymerase III subunit beta [Betaproteobacteria bacterium]|jgi:DNA polymerase-3 subunit beta|nr:DNA polymerase III subunit beta [Betaproteobacteria bacterium]MBK7080605.1 DNA polymerase III subunit beta [Betaproteobacteria bacterium]MBK7592295.1 DNA polymerase III subunit beta [Betaproteobacteria bacterium]MBK7742304.1 DNA polymerase III subunit beta [Betaproteobacteria bacterium]MBK8688811.1 DNA polymerase III subunit beta [Betaproteobacteria bacterium]
MQLKQIARDALLKPLQAVSGIVERRHTLPILANVLLEHRDGRLYVTATDLEMQITAHSELPGKEAQAVTVAARKLQDLLRALPDDATLNVDAGNNKMTVRAGRSRFNLQTLPAADYPRIGVGQDQVQQLSLPQRDLRGLIKAAEFAMAQQDIRYYLNGMLLVIDNASLQAVATDGHRLSWASLKVDGSYQRQEVILPRKTVLELGKLLADADEPVRIDVLANQVRFSFGNVELVSKVVDGKFPDYNRVIPTGHARAIELPRTELLAALQRAAILSNEKFRGVRLVLGAGQLKIICSNSEQEEAEEELEVDYRGDALDIGFNITYLLDVLQNQPMERVQLAFGDANSSALITIPDRDDYKYVVMPMRI